MWTQVFTAGSPPVLCIESAMSLHVQRHWTRNVKPRPAVLLDPSVVLPEHHGSTASKDGIVEKAVTKHASEGTCMRHYNEPTG